MKNQKCVVCRNPLSDNPEKVFRVNLEWKKREEELLQETKELAETLSECSFCGSCADEVRLSGLKVVSVAEIKRWGQRGKANSLLERIGENQEADIATLGNKFRVVKGRG